MEGQGGVGAWTLAPDDAGEKLVGIKVATTPADFLPNPEELRRQSCFSPTQPQKTLSDRKKRGWLASPSCWLHPGALSNDRAPWPSHNPFPSAWLKDDLTNRNPFSETATGRIEFFGFSTLEFEKLKDGDDGGGRPHLK